MYRGMIDIEHHTGCNMGGSFLETGPPRKMGLLKIPVVGNKKLL